MTKRPKVCFFFFQTNIQQAEVVAGRIAIIQYFNDPGKQIAVAPENRNV